MMVSEKHPQITVRDADGTDITALTAIKGEGSDGEGVHQNRLRDAREGSLRYLVLLADQEIIGFACLVFRRPVYWSDASDTQHLPHIIDLQVKESQRRKGYGSAFVRAIEQIAAEAEYEQLYISVEPGDNPLAYALYLRLGFQQLQSEPYLKIWEFKDSAGKVHHGEDWVVDMVKDL
jgi:ribosomal protein S18 acetylase RimI-like enzyme